MQNLQSMAKQVSLDSLLARIDSALEVLDDEDLPLEQAFDAYSDGLKAMQAAHKVLAGYEERFQALQAEADQVMAELNGSEEE